GGHGNWNGYHLGAAVISGAAGHQARPARPRDVFSKAITAILPYQPRTTECNFDFRLKCYIIITLLPQLVSASARSWHFSGGQDSLSTHDVLLPIRTLS